VGGVPGCKGDSLAAMRCEVLGGPCHHGGALAAEGSLATEGVSPGVTAGGGGSRQAGLDPGGSPALAGGPQLQGGCWETLGRGLQGWGGWDLLLLRAERRGVTPTPGRAGGCPQPLGCPQPPGGGPQPPAPMGCARGCVVQGWVLGTKPPPLLRDQAPPRGGPQTPKPTLAPHHELPCPAGCPRGTGTRRLLP